MVLKFNIKLAKRTESLFFFMGEVHRLCAGSKSFIFCFKNGRKLYLKTCNGLQNNAYICTVEREKLDPIITALNYAIALQAQLNLSLNIDTLTFEISSSNIEKLQAFFNSLNVEFEIS